MDKSRPYPLKRRFEVHFPLKRPKATHSAEPQEQNPLQTYLGKRKAGPGLDALLSEARAETNSQKVVDFNPEEPSQALKVDTYIGREQTAALDRGPDERGSQQAAAKKHKGRQLPNKSMLTGLKASPAKKKLKTAARLQEEIKKSIKRKKQTVQSAKPERKAEHKTRIATLPTPGEEVGRKQPRPQKQALPGRSPLDAQAKDNTSGQENPKHGVNGPAEAVLRSSEGGGSSLMLNTGLTGRLGGIEYPQAEPQRDSRKSRWDAHGAGGKTNGSGPFVPLNRDGASGLAKGVTASLSENKGNLSSTEGAATNGSKQHAAGLPLGQEAQVSLQAQECQRLWEALQHSLSTWKSVLVQRDAEVSERSASLAQQNAQSKKQQEAAAEQLALARRLKQAAEEIHGAAIQERLRASAELAEARRECLAVERAKEELDSRREELAVEAMELDQKRKLCEEALAKLEAEKRSAHSRTKHSDPVLSQTVRVSRDTAPQKTGVPPNPPGQSLSGKGLSDISKANPDVLRASADVSKSCSDKRMLNGKPMLSVIGCLIRDGEESGGPSPLGSYHGFGKQQAVKREADDLVFEGEQADATREASGRESGQKTEGKSKEEGGAETSSRREGVDGRADEEAESDAEDDVPLSFRNGKRKRAQSFDVRIVPESNQDGTVADRRISRSADCRIAEAASLVGEVKAELAKGPNLESVSAASGAGANLRVDSKTGPHSPRTGPLGRYPPLTAHPTAHNGLKKQRRKRTAIEVLQKDAPELLESLSETGMLDEMKLYGEDFEGDDEAAQSASFRVLQNILNKIYGSTPSRNGQAWTSTGNLGQSQLPKYCMGALKVLTDEAKRLRKGNRPVEWGWCHALHAFLFVFEEQNRFVLEWPHYGNATYFFNMEAREVEFQLRRLIAVLSIAGVSKNDIVVDRPLEMIKGIPAEDLRVLEDFGRKPETGLGSFLNFANRVVHDYKDECTLEQWQSRIRTELHQGRNTGQIDKSPGVSIWAALDEVVPIALEGAWSFRQQEVLAVKEELG